MTCGLRHGALLAKSCMQLNTPCFLRKLAKTSFSNLPLQLKILTRYLNMQSCPGKVAHPKSIVLENLRLGTKTWLGTKLAPQENQGSATLGLSSTNCACMHATPCLGKTSASRPKLKKELVRRAESKQRLVLGPAREITGKNARGNIKNYSYSFQNSRH